ncbi:MAG: sugar phosphate isomerase/epimerase [Bryobacteraceae bacterium]
MTRRTFAASLAAISAWARRSGIGIDRLTVATGSLAGFTLEAGLAEIKRLGFGGVEIFADLDRSHSIGRFPSAIVGRLTPREKKVLRRQVGGFRHVTTHLPFHDLRPVDPDPAVRERSRAAIERGIADSGWWGASMATVHVARENAGYRGVWKDLLDTYRHFGDLAAKNKLRIGIETGAPETVAEYLALIREIAHDHVGSTVDTGHTRAYRRDAKLADAELGSEMGRQCYNDLLMRKVEGLGPKLFHFHVDDVRASDWREHRALGQGIVDWTRLLRYLGDSGYQGVFAMELEETAVVESLKQSREFFRGRLESL